MSRGMSNKGKPLTIGYFGDGPWSHRALEKIIASNQVQVLFIVARFDTRDPVLQRFAQQLGVPFLVHEDVNSPGFREQIADFGADLLVSMSFNQILRRDILHLAPGGFINCHAGALPMYRGRNILNWALINGEEAFGVTVHYVDEGIDTGDIIRQDLVPITPQTTYADILELAYEQCADTLLHALLDIRNGGVQRRCQSDIHPTGLYCGRRGPGDEWINWEWSSERIYNFIRALSLPGPCARTMYNGKPLAVLQAELIDGAPDYICTSGEVVGRHERGVIVKTGTSTLLVTEVASVEDSGALLNVRTPALKMGGRMGINLMQTVLDLQQRVQTLERELEELRAENDA